MLEDLVYHCSEDVLESKIDDEIVLMSLSKGLYFGLDEVGSRIWELLKMSPRSLTDLTTALQDEYEVDDLTCREETKNYLAQLAEQGLVFDVP